MQVVRGDTFWVNQVVELALDTAPEDRVRTTVASIGAEKLALMGTKGIEGSSMFRVGAVLRVLFVRPKLPPVMLRTVVASLERNPWPLLVIRRDDARLQVNERRRFLRLPVVLPCQCSIVRPALGRMAWETRTSFVSVSGVFVMSGANALEKELLTIALPLPAEDPKTLPTPIEVKGRIARSLRAKDDPRPMPAAVSFLTLPIQVDEQIHRFLMLVEREPARFVGC